MPEARVGTFVRSVRPLIVISGCGMCAAFCESWVPLEQAAVMRRTNKAVSVRMKLLSHRSDILDFYFLELFPAGLEFNREPQRDRPIRAERGVHRDGSRRPEGNAVRGSRRDDLV